MIFKPQQMKTLFRGILVALMMSISFGTISAQQVEFMEFFHGAECPHCHKQMKFLPVIEAMYPNLDIRQYEVWHSDENKAFADTRLAEFGTRLEGVPTNIIGEDIIVGFQPDAMLASIESEFGAPLMSRAEAELLLPAKNSARQWIFIAVILLVIGGVVYSFNRPSPKK